MNIDSNLLFIFIASMLFTIGYAERIWFICGIAAFAASLVIIEIDDPMEGKQ